MAKKEKILELIDDHKILFEKENATKAEVEAAHKRQNIRDKKLEKYFKGKVAVTDAQQKEADRLMKIEEKKMKVNPDYIPKIIDPEDIRIAEKPKSNGKYTIPTINMDSFDWDIWLREKMGPKYETLEEENKRKVEAESLYEKYLELLKAGELLPGTTFQMFEKNYLDFDTDVFTKIKKRVNEKKRIEGLASLLGVDPGRIKI